MRAIDAGILICGECHELNRQDPETDEQTCTRCGALVHARRPDSLMRTLSVLEDWVGEMKVRPIYLFLIRPIP